MKVGLAQRDVPAHVAHEYCRRDRSFYPCPSFNVEQETLPRDFEFMNYETGDEESWYPLGSSTTGLGFDFGLIRQVLDGAGGLAWLRGGSIDLAAVSHLDEVRDADLRRSREILQPADPEPDHELHV